MNKLNTSIAVFLLIALSISCSNGDNRKSASKDKAKSTNELTAFQLKNGIGPFTKKINLKEIDPDLAAKGQKIFEEKCSACHKAAERYVGPQLDDMLQRRTPEYILNMMLNPEEMVKRHPEAKKMLAKFFTPMPNQNVAREDAIAILEYIRANQK